MKIADDCRSEMIINGRGTSVVVSCFVEDLVLSVKGE
jgi:hypothetical protein